jgi:hypothetical protein
LDGGGILEAREGEGVGAAAPVAEVLDRFAGGVMVVAELLEAEAGALAAMAA